MFTTALEQLGRFRGEGTFAGWLFQIARNAVRDVQRRQVPELLVVERPGVDPTPRLAARRLAGVSRLVRRGSGGRAQAASTGVA